jgi:hypothetical protein
VRYRWHKKLYGSIKESPGILLFPPNSRPLCAIYNGATEVPPIHKHNDAGATIAFNVLDINGSYVGHSHIEKEASRKGSISEPVDYATLAALLVT